MEIGGLDTIVRVTDSAELRHIQKLLTFLGEEKFVVPPGGGERGHEIQSWLDGWSELGGDAIDSFAILDDCADMAHLADRLVQTSWSEGLQARHVELVINLLKEKQSMNPRQEILEKIAAGLAGVESVTRSTYSQFCDGPREYDGEECVICDADIHDDRLEDHAESCAYRLAVNLKSGRTL